MWDTLKYNEGQFDPRYRKIVAAEPHFDIPIDEKTKEIIAMEIAHENQDRCRKLVFKIMEKHIEGWWD